MKVVYNVRVSDKVSEIYSVSVFFGLVGRAFVWLDHTPVGSGNSPVRCRLFFPEAIPVQYKQCHVPEPIIQCWSVAQDLRSDPR